MNTLKRITFFVTAMTLLVGYQAMAADPTDFEDGFDALSREVAADPGLISFRTSEYVLGGIITWMFSLAAIVALGVLVWGGFSYMTSLGDDSKAAQAKKVILYGIIGLIIIVGSFAILATINSVLN